MEPGGIDDPYNHLAYLGLERAVQELGIRGRVLTPAPKEGFVPALSLLARQKYDLVMGTGLAATPAVDSVAARFPETRFAIIDCGNPDRAHRPTTRVEVSSSGLDWGDFGIGAGAMLGLALLLGGTAAAVHYGRRSSVQPRTVS